MTIEQVFRGDILQTAPNISVRCHYLKLTTVAILGVASISTNRIVHSQKISSQARPLVVRSCLLDPTAYY